MEIEERPDQTRPGYLLFSTGFGLSLTVAIVVVFVVVVVFRTRISFTLSLD